MTRKNKKASLTKFSCLSPRRTPRSWVASLVTVFVLVTYHSGNPLAGRVTVFALTQSQTTGRIAGIVRDQNGAIIAGGELVVKSLATAQQRKVTTDDSGNYALSPLPPGSYRVSVTANGFKRAEVESVRVVITETFTLDFSLEVGPITQEEVVSAASMQRL